jgi:outer membrane receptor protein involved in Fe transport
VTLGLVFSLALSLAQAGVSGTVSDATGGVVAGADVTLRTDGGPEHRTRTGQDGGFSFDVPADAAILIVRAAGFAPIEHRVSGPGHVEFVLSPAGVLDAVTVTPTRTEARLGSIPASVTVLDAHDVQTTAAVVADDLLRQVPTFSLFRRTSSLSSHPTSQGVSLRGIGPSGVSRTLVLMDDIPFNDPFGGWVYWTRVPLDSVDRVEVVDGPSSNLYGSYAMGGVINIVSRRPSARTMDVRAQYGSRDSPKVDLFASDVWKSLGVSIEGNAFSTDGFPIVVGSERGAVDTDARVEFRNVNVRLDHRPGGRLHAFARSGSFREVRDNGKVSTFTGDPEANDTTWRFVNGGLGVVLPDRSELELRLFADFETFHSTFLAVPNLTTRAIGRMSLDQRVPTRGVGGMIQWSRAFGGRHHVTAGADWRSVDGDSKEQVLDAVTGTTVVTERVSGGRQRSLGAFVQDIFTPAPDLTVTLSARIDNWKNLDGHNLETTVATGLPTPGHQPDIPDRADTVASPRIAALYRLTERVSAWGALAWGFRAPTLNELYRQFRVGATLTLANDQLGPERLVGGEAGLNLAVTRDLTIRTTWYDSRVKYPVSNVTIAANTQQRQNLGRTHIRGLQADVDYRLGSSWTLSGGYLFSRARVTAFDANPDLVGNVLPQVPRHRGSVQALYSHPQLAAVGFSLRFVGRQFDDDQNLRTVPGQDEPGLPGFFVSDLTASRAITRRLQAFVGVQNLFGEEYFVGTNPTTVGSPRLVHAGVRVRLAGG